MWKRLTNDDALTHHKWFASQRLSKLLCSLEPYAPIIKWDRKCQSHYRHVMNRVHDLSIYHSLTVSSLKYSFNDMISRRYGLHPRRWDWHLRVEYDCQFQREQEQCLPVILSISIPLPAGLHKWLLSAKNRERKHRRACNLVIASHLNILLPPALPFHTFCCRSGGKSQDLKE